MKPRFEFSLTGLLVFLTILLAIGALSAMPADAAIARIVQGWWLVAWLAFLSAGSVVVVARMWRARGDAGAVRRAAHGGQLALLPETWRRWVLGESGED